MSGNIWMIINNRSQPNFEVNFLGKVCIFFMNVLGKEAQNKDSPDEDTVDTSVAFTISERLRVFTCHEEVLVSKSSNLRMKCKEQENKSWLDRKRSKTPLKEKVQLAVTTRYQAATGSNC